MFRRDLKGLVERLKPLADEADGLIALWLFGSVVRGEATPLSDIDVAYLPEDRLRGEELERFESALFRGLTELLGTDDLSLVNVLEAPDFLALEVLREGKLVLCRDGELLARAVERIYSRAPDLKLLRHMGNSDFLEGFDMSAPKVDGDRVIELLRLISEDLRSLREKAGLDLQLYLNDRDLQAVVERRLQTAIESALNVGNHIIARLGLRAPQTYADVFHILCEEGIISPKLAEAMADMARLRNLLVYLYRRIDHRRIYESLSDRIRALEEFVRQIRGWLTAQSPQGG
ncbi:hypothetical protein DRP77_06960 [Candidatus Poribacteria bacterium]|nr:MAG: hypothetical protein DRP77_06960 [Candidatus Poribacteria bacterium]